ncbi:MAG: hypothetical protein JO001_06425 [Alphaproteobacteria bacterium]|nr:hypothetical protein [Alphaproteobacteria bacterium]
MASSRRDILRRHGYLSESEVEALIGRVVDRLASIDEAMTREYVIDPFPGGIEHKIALLCRRRKLVLTKLVEQELEHMRPGPKPEAADA